jgi:hypothetical protein
MCCPQWLSVSELHHVNIIKERYLKAVRSA